MLQDYVFLLSKSKKKGGYLITVQTKAIIILPNGMFAVVYN